MQNMPLKLRKFLDQDPFYHACARKGLKTLEMKEHVCGGRITWEHSLIFAGKQIQKAWAIVPLCAKAHEVDEFQDSGEMDKGINVWIALNRATDDEIVEISKARDYFQFKSFLNKKYGPYVPPPLPNARPAIDYPWLRPDAMRSPHSL